MSKYYVMRGKYIIKSYDSEKEADSMANHFTADDININCFEEDYRVISEEELKREIAIDHNIDPDNDYLGDKTDRQNFFQELEKLNIK